MMKLLSGVLLLFSSPIFAQQTESRTSADEYRHHAGLFIEPIAQYTQVDSEIKTSQLPIIRNDTSGAVEGAGLGLRLGAHAFDILFLGADGRYSKLKFKDSAYGDVDEGSAYNYGPTIGLQTPLFGIRVWGTYVMGGEFDPGAGANRVDVKFQDARGSRVGAGIRVAMLSVNLEYEDLKYDKTNVESVGNLNVDSVSDVDFGSKGYLLSLSFPLSL